MNLYLNDEQSSLLLLQIFVDLVEVWHEALDHKDMVENLDIQVQLDNQNKDVDDTNALQQKVDDASMNDEDGKDVLPYVDLVVDLDASLVVALMLEVVVMMLVMLQLIVSMVVDFVMADLVVEEAH